MKIEHREMLKSDTPSVHAATIAFYKDKPVFSWFGGSREGNPDVAIYVQAGDKVHVIGDKDQIPRWNPILFPYKDGLYLFTKSGTFCDRWQTFIHDISGIWDEDFDLTKCRVQILPAGLNGPVKTKPIVVDNDIYCGSSVETIYDWTSYIEVYSKWDKDKPFDFVSRTPPLTVPKKRYKNRLGMNAVTLGIIQPSLWIDRDGILNAFFRSSRGLGTIYHSERRCSDEELKIYDWTSPQETSLENPNSGIDAVYCYDKLYLAHNPSSDYRYPLVVSQLRPSFKIKESLVIREKVESSFNDWNTKELSYPYMIEHEEALHLVYTYGRAVIEHCIIDISQ